MGSRANTETPDESVEFRRGLFRNRDFLVPYVAETQSIGGDQIGRVALSILVFDRTGSVAWTALTYALTFLPAILGGFLLGGAGDRFSRVQVMVLADIARAALFVTVAIPGVPLAVVVTLVAIAFFLGPAFTAAMVARLAETLVPDQFRAASGIRMISSQTVQVGGFALGGVIVAAVHPRIALVVNAATFAFSALIVGAALRSRDGSATARDAARPVAVPAPAPRLFADPWLRHLMLMTALAAFFVVPEGLAVPLASKLDVSTTVTGLLLAAGPLGSAIGAAVLVRFVPRRRGMSAAHAMAVGCGLPLIVTAALPPWPVVAVCWALSGALWAYQIDVATAVVHSVPDSSRSRVVSRASAVLLGAQGAGLIAFGELGDWLGADWAVALSGLVGTTTAAVVVLAANRSGIGPDGNRARHRASRMPGIDKSRDVMSET